MKEHPSIEVVVDEEGEEDGVMVTTDALTEAFVGSDENTYEDEEDDVLSEVTVID